MARHHDPAVTCPSEAGYPQPATRANPVVAADVADSATATRETVADATADSESCSNDPAANNSCTRAATAVSSTTATCNAGPDGTSGDITDAVLMNMNVRKGSDSASS